MGREKTSSRTGNDSYGRGMIDEFNDSEFMVGGTDELSPSVDKK